MKEKNESLNQENGFSVQAGNCITISKKTDLRNSCKERILRKLKRRESSSEKEHKENALALGADEGRDKLRKASGSSKYALIRRCPNGETPHGSCRVTLK